MSCLFSAPSGQCLQLLLMAKSLRQFACFIWWMQKSANRKWPADLDCESAVAAIVYTHRRRLTLACLLNTKADIHFTIPRRIDPDTVVKVCSPFHGYIVVMLFMTHHKLPTEGVEWGILCTAARHVTIRPVLSSYNVVTSHTNYEIQCITIESKSFTAAQIANTIAKSTKVLRSRNQKFIPGMFSLVSLIPFLLFHSPFFFPFPVSSPTSKWPLKCS